MGWTRRTHGSVAFTMAAILMLAACGGDGGGPAGGATGGGDGGTPEGACDLLTDDEVAAASGYSIGKIEQADDPTGGRCTWTLESGDAAAPSFVTLVLYVSRGKALFAAGAPGSERAQKGTTSVQGIGDGAYFAEVAGRPTLTVLVGNSAFFVQYFPGQGDDSDAEQAVRELAPLAAGRL